MENIDVVVQEREEFIEMRHLRYFVTLAEELHFARAAERLRMEQSPLSRAIRQMERMLGVRLFERNTRSTRITRAGTVLLEYAKRAIALLDQAATSARSAALGHSKRLRIGVSDCTAYARMMEILVRYRIANPDVAVCGRRSAALHLHRMPFQRDRLERVAGGVHLGELFLPFDVIGVDSLGQQLARLVALLPGLGKRCGRVHAQRQGFLPTGVAVAHPPVLPATFDVQVEPLPVGMFAADRRSSQLEVSNKSISQCHIAPFQSPRLLVPGRPRN
jgi:molybdenum-dependent DNA-binding transcriptional regulator ModE